MLAGNLQNSIKEFYLVPEKANDMADVWYRRFEDRRLVEVHVHRQSLIAKEADCRNCQEKRRHVAAEKDAEDLVGGHGGRSRIDSHGG